MENLKNMFSQFMEMNCAVWIPTVIGIAAFFIIILPLLISRSKWKEKVQEAETAAEEELQRAREKAQKEIEEAKKAAQNEINIVREEADKKVEESRQAAKEEIQKICEEADKKMADLVKTSELERMEEKENSKRAVIETREAIKTEEAELKQADEKQLLVRTVMALSGYGTRLDRIEEALAGMEKRSRYPAGSSFAAQNSAQNTPLLDSLRDELNSVSR